MGVQKMAMLRKCANCLKQNSRIPRLTFNALTNNIEQTQKFDWCDTFIDASIMSGLTFFSALGGASVAVLEGISALKAATVAACAQLFVFLALKRGIIQKEELNH
jgi:hypothetical protein